LRRARAEFGAKEAILDGELVALDKDGMPRFQLLQNKLRIRSGSYAHASKAQIVYFAFDLLYVDGFDFNELSRGRAQGEARREFCDRQTSSNNPNTLKLTVKSSSDTSRSFNLKE